MTPSLPGARSKVEKPGGINGYSGLRNTTAARSLSAAEALSAVEVLSGQAWRRAGQPAVGDRVSQRRDGDIPQLDEHSRISVEVRNREEGCRVGSEHGFLLAEILDADGQDRPVGRGIVAEPLQIGLAERPFPGEGLAGDEPGPVAVTVILSHLGQFKGYQRRVVNSRHTATVMLCAVSEIGR